MCTSRNLIRVTKNIKYTTHASAFSECQWLAIVVIGLRFEIPIGGRSFRENVGTVPLCVTYRGDNVPSTIEASFNQHYDGEHF